jgi:hypothetical protein
MARFRFNLRTVFVLATVVVAFCGFSQWRRQNILRVRDELRTLGVEVAIPNGLNDFVWQSRPQYHTFTSDLDWQDPPREEIEQRLRWLGISTFPPIAYPYYGEVDLSGSL